MKEFLEKRWWQGIGGIAALTAIVIAILQWQGIVDISWLAMNITLNIILAVILALVAARAIRWKRKYEVLSQQYEVTSQRVEEILRMSERITERKRVLLADQSNMWKLNIDDDLLNELYGQAYSRAFSKYHDAKLSGFAILVHPYAGDKVSIQFEFSSQWAGRQCTLIVGERGDMVESSPHASIEYGATFDKLPWIQCPNWSQFLRLSCEKAGPLPQAPWSNYILMVGGEFEWSVAFEDGVTGETTWLYWDGKGEPIPKER